MRCIVKDCPNYYYSTRKKKKISYFQFPNDPLMKQRWMNILKIDKTKTDCDNAKICSKHFEDSAFKNPKSTKKQLFSYAIPTYFKVRKNIPLIIIPMTELSVEQSENIDSTSDPLAENEINIELSKEDFIYSDNENITSSYEVGEQ